MERLSDILQPYKTIIGLTAAIVTVGQFLSGLLLCLEIRKNKSTKGISITPFTGGCVISVISLHYGWILQDVNMLAVNLIGAALNFGYILFFFANSTNDSTKSAIRTTSLCGALATAIISYGIYEDPKLVLHRYGLIVTILLLLLIASPLFNLAKIIETKSSASLPFPIIVSGTVVSFMWLLYGIVIRNDFLVIQNVVAVALCVVQLSLFVIYPNLPKSDSKLKKKNK